MLGHVALILTAVVHLGKKVFDAVSVSHGPSARSDLRGDYREARVDCFQYTGCFTFLFDALGTLGLVGCWENIISACVKATLSSVRECLSNAEQDTEKIRSSRMSLRLRGQAQRLRSRYKIWVSYLPYLTLQCHTPPV